MMLNYILAAGSVAAAIYLFVSKNKPKKIETTQELLDFEDIAEDGLIRLSGQRYRKVIKVYPINIATKSVKEQSGIWETFRTMMNSIIFPVTFLVQSTHLDITDYTIKVKQNVDELEKPILREFGDDYISHIKALADSKELRSQRYYMILKIDVSADTIDSGVEVEDNTIAMAINSLLKVANRPKKLSSIEAERLARSELDNMATVIGSYLAQMGIKYEVLNDKGVVDMVYTTYNRDLSTIIRTKEVDELEAFSLFTKSLTPEMLSKERRRESRKIVQEVENTKT